MRALVLGGPGFIGVAACKELMRRGVETIAASRTAQPYGTFTSHLALDRADLRQLARALAESEPDVLVDLAPAGPEEAQWVAANFAGRHVLAACAGSPAPGPGGPRRVVVRPGPVIGGGDPTLRIAAYLQRLEDGGPLLVPAETYRRPAGLAWVRDAGHALALAADLARPVEGSSFDVAFDGASLAELLETLGQVMGRPAELVPVPTAEMPPGSDPYGPPPEQDLGPARAELGFQPSALEDCLAEVLAWYRATKPSHPGYAGRAAELELARSAR